MIKFDNVSFRYTDDGEDILKNINFTLEAGSYHFLTGPSGSGKTSLMNLLYLGNLPTSGKVQIFGQDIHTLERTDFFKIRQQIGIIFEDFRLLNHVSAFENVALPLKIIGRPQDEIEKHVNELLDWVGLGKHKNHLPLTLSGGQQQRIAIARAVIDRPKLLLADEPTGNLDDDIGFRLMGLFEQLNRMGTTILIATHNNQIIEQFGHPCLKISDGKIGNEEESREKIERKIRNVF